METKETRVFAGTQLVLGIIIVTVLVALTGSSSYAASGNPLNCLDVFVKSGYTAPDGDYIIEPVHGKIFTVYCKDMNSADPGWKEYLTLVNTGGDRNFSQSTAGGVWSGTSIRTNYTKVRIDPTTFVVDISDDTFATTTGELCRGGGCWSNRIPYGAAVDCGDFGSHTGIANIDLTGTPFAVDDVFYTNGYACAGSVTVNGQTANLPCNEQAVSVTSPVVDITGGGFCGGSGPHGFNSRVNTWISSDSSVSMLALQLKWVGN